MQLFEHALSGVGDVKAKQFQIDERIGVRQCNNTRDQKERLE